MGSFVASGFFRPETPMLQRLREGLVADRAGWAKVERSLSNAGLELAADDTLVRAPKGFEAAPEQFAEILKLKSWVVRRERSAEVIDRSRLASEIMKLATNAAAFV